MPRGFSLYPIWRRIAENASFNPNNGCIEWTGSRTAAGYGVIQFRGKKEYIHRLAWALEYGAAPTKHLCHRCDNPRCFNLQHLFEGDDSANNTDKMLKGRAAKKLTTEQVAGIYEARGPLKKIAAHYGVAFNTVWSIKHGLCWAHVTGHPKPSA
jgi:hypothetical protein